MYLVVFHTAFLKVRVRKVQQSVVTEHTVYGALQNICRFVAERARSIYILFKVCWVMGLVPNGDAVELS